VGADQSDRGTGSGRCDRGAHRALPGRMKGSSMDIVEFLRARLDEDEAVARECVIPAQEGTYVYKPHPELAEWFYDGDEVEYVQTPEMRAHKYPDRYCVTVDSEGLTPSVEGDIATHIARHDPARVLREVEAKRRVVDEHGGRPPYH